MQTSLFEMLREDHLKAKAILRLLDATKENSLRRRDKLFSRLKTALVPHMKAEEFTFYRALLAKKQARENTLEGVEEHHVSDMVFKELEMMPKGTEEWSAKISVFKELVEHHIKDEEDKIFKSAKKTLDEGELQTIMKRFSQEKKRVKGTLTS